MKCSIVQDGQLIVIEGDYDEVAFIINVLDGKVSVDYDNDDEDFYEETTLQ